MSQAQIAAAVAAAYLAALASTGLFRKGLLPAILIRIRQTLLQSFAWLSGVLMGALAADPRPEPAGLFMALFVMASYFWTDPFLNDRFDLAIDRMSNPERPGARGLITPQELPVLYAVLVPFPLLMSFFMSRYAFAVMIVVVLSSLAYNIPPVRLKRFLVTSQLFPGLWATGAVCLGYFGQTSQLNPWFYRSLAAAFFTIVLTAGYKDLKDEEADRENGIRNLVTVLGHRRAGRVMAPLTVIVFTALPFLFQAPHYAIGTSILGVIGAVFLWRFHPRDRKKILPRMAGLLGALALSLAYLMATIERL